MAVGRCCLVSVLAGPASPWFARGGIGKHLLHTIMESVPIQKMQGECRRGPARTESDYLRAEAPVTPPECFLSESLSPQTDGQRQPQTVPVQRAAHCWGWSSSLDGLWV